MKAHDQSPSRLGTHLGLREQLDAMGRFTPEVSEAYAQLHEQFFRVMAARTGADIDALYAQYKLTVRGPAPAWAGNLSQNDKSELDEISSVDLIAAHNLSPENLRVAIELGGLAAPSIAITKLDAPIDGFGSITLIGNTALATPSAKNPIFDADVYSPRFPPVRVKVDEKLVRERLAPLMAAAARASMHARDPGSAISEMTRNHLADAIDALSNDAGLRLGYAINVQGVDLQVPKKQVPPKPVAKAGAPIIEQSPLKEYLATIDIGSLTPDTAGDLGQKIYAALVNKTLADLHAQGKGSPSDVFEMGMELVNRRIRLFAQSEIDVGSKDFAPDKVGQMTSKGLYTLYNLQRNERSAMAAASAPTSIHETPALEVDTAALNQLLDEHAPTEALKAWLREQLSSAMGTRKVVKENGSTGPYTLNQIVKSMTRQVRDAEGFNYGLGNARSLGAKRLQTFNQIRERRDQIVSQADFDAASKGLRAQFTELAKEITPFQQYERDSAFELLAQAIGKSYGMPIDQALQEASLRDVPPKLQQRIADFAIALTSAPTEYFEAKPQRAVKLSEFVGAVIPHDTPSDIQEMITSQGLAIAHYPRGNRSLRQQAIKRLAQTLHQQQSDVLFQSDNSAFKALPSQTEEASAIVRMSLSRTSAREVRFTRIIARQKNPADKARMQGFIDFMTGEDSKESQYSTISAVSYLQGRERGRQTRERLKGAPWLEVEKARDGSKWIWNIYKEGYWVVGGDARSEASAEEAIIDARVALREQRSAQSDHATSLPPTIEIDGKQRPTTNSNGQPIAQTEEGVRNFWAWFGESKVVDAQGKPLVVYHGTTADVEQFDLEFSGADGVGYNVPAIFATTDKALASDYALNKFDREIADAIREMQRFKNTNPGVYNDDYERRFRAVKDAFAKQRGEGSPELGGGANVVPLYMRGDMAEVDANGQRFMAVMPKALPEFMAQGKDGVIVNDVVDNASPATDYPARIFVTFAPANVKSATGNDGTFDPANPNILNQQARGTFNPQTLLISLNENANLSTFLHESGHFFLEVMADLASQPNAPAQVQEDMAQVLAWFGIKGDETVGGADSGEPLAQAAPQTDKTISAGVEFVAQIERLAETHGRVYIRWSPSAKGDLSGAQQSRDFQSGEVHWGLSAVEITEDTHVVDIAKRLAEYSYLRMQDRRSVPHVYLARRVGTDSDGYASIKPDRLLLDSTPDVVRAIDAKLADVMDAMDDIQRESAKLEKYPGHAAVTERLNAAKARLAKLLPNDPNILSQNGPTTSAPPIQPQRTPLETWRAMTLDQKRPYHEKFAESFEAYLLEGKAPTQELQPLYTRLSTWLADIYTCVSNFLTDRKLTINDDIRAVFDRMLHIEPCERNAEDDEMWSERPRF